MVTAAMVKELRDMTGAGMLDCQKALKEVDGNMDKAVFFIVNHDFLSALNPSRHRSIFFRPFPYIYTGSRLAEDKLFALFRKGREGGKKCE